MAAGDHQGRGAGYDTELYAMMTEHAASAATAVLPLVLRYLYPRSVVDYGCGAGGWLRAFQGTGVESVFGVDGPWLDQDELLISREDFCVHDLGTPFTTDRQFELAVCLEVVGHIRPSEEAAFLDSLTRLAPALVFSAPIPHQPGVGPLPLNNRWPAYWAAQFAHRDFVWIDCLRHQIWDDPRVVWWYAQNIALVVHQDHLAEIPGLVKERAAGPEVPPSLVHPGLLELLSRPFGPP